jgi:deoxyribodipyrimidine photo-lyase
MPSSNIIIYWFRQDLRLSDNPALTAAAKAGTVLPVYVLDDDNAKNWKMGGASRWWLHHSLKSLNKSLDGKLVFLKGDASEELIKLAKQTKAIGVYWNRCYEPWRVKRDKHIKEALKDLDIEAHSFNGSLLWEPWEVVKNDGTPYKVFTPFYRKGCLGKEPPREPIKKPALTLANSKEGVSLDDLKLLPHKPEPRWDKKMEQYWTISEDGAKKLLHVFLDNGLKNYKDGRDFMIGDHSSRLSPYLHFGEISPNQVWYAVKHKGEAEHWNKDTDHFCSELGWREFSYNLLYHVPTLPDKNLQQRFDKFPWGYSKKYLQAWQRGRTGYPIVDAAMRELWETGIMHNRARMIVGSFFVKHLLLDWREGEKWFWDCLCDADLASNAFNWQWIAGSGADAAPYFRIFNPVTQGEKFDAQGDYVRRFVPELSRMPDKYIHKPWDTPPDVLTKAGVVLGKTYPEPVVDHADARERALAAFSKTKG